MGLYDDRLADLSESRRSRVAGRQPSRTGRQPSRTPPGERAPRQSPFAKPRSVQSLLFQRDSGWTPPRAKEWAKAHGYKHGSADVTGQHVRLRQSPPNGLKVERTITLGRGIRAVVAREEIMPKKARRTRRSPKKAPRKKARRARKTRATEARRQRRRSSTVMQAPRRKRRVAKKSSAPRRRRRRVSAVAAATTTTQAWRGDVAGHRKAAKKGVKRRKSRRAAAKKRRRSSKRRVRSTVMEAAAPRRRRRRSVRSNVVAAKRGRRRSYARAPRRGSSGVAEFAAAFASAGFGFVIADGLDRFLATYNPSATEMPKDKFTSDGAGTLANTLNVASMPGFARIGAGLGVAAVPAVASMYVRNPLGKAALQGAALGSGVSFFKLLWNNLLMPLLKPKDTSAASLQKSYIARLYPSEIAAAINREAKQTAVSSGGSGALSAPPDVGPFALGGDSAYPDAAQALRREAGMQGPGSEYPTQQNVWGTGAEAGAVAEYPTAAQSLYKETGRTGDAWAPGPPPGTGPGPQAEPGVDPSCGCIGDDNQFLGFVGDNQEEALYPTP